MRVLFLISHLSGGGAQRQTGYLAAELQRRGHDVLLAYMFAGPGAAPAVPLRALPERRIWSPMQIADVLRLIRDWKPDVVQTCLAQTDVIGAIACRIAGVPFVLREARHVGSYHGGLEHRLRAFIGQSAAAIIANSSGGAEYWSRFTPRVPLRIVPNGIAVSDAPPAERPANPVGVFTGRLVAEKNIDVLLHACARAARNITLFVCGDGSDRPRLESLAKALEVDTRFMGHLPDVTPYQRAADFAALLSEHEGHPNAVAEAFAVGTPVILSDTRAHREFADAAMLVPLHDADATAAAIRSILDAPPLARIERGRALAAQWSIEAMASAYERVYVSVRHA